MGFLIFIDLGSFIELDFKFVVSNGIGFSSNGYGLINNGYGFISNGNGFYSNGNGYYSNENGFSSNGKGKGVFVEENFILKFFLSGKLENGECLVSVKVMVV